MTSPHVLRDDVTILTGAFTGIGRALALALADVGANLVLATRDEAALGIGMWARFEDLKDVGLVDRVAAQAVRRGR